MKQLSTIILACAALGLCAGAQAASSAAQIDFTTCAKPVYPADAVRAQREGTVSLKFLVARNGTVALAKVSKSSGHGDLDTAARDALKLCKFTPAMKAGKARKAWSDVQYVWTLD